MRLRDCIWVLWVILCIGKIGVVSVYECPRGGAEGPCRILYGLQWGLRVHYTHSSRGCVYIMGEYPYKGCMYIKGEYPCKGVCIPARVLCKRVSQGNMLVWLVNVFFGLYGHGLYCHAFIVTQSHLPPGKLTILNIQEHYQDTSHTPPRPLNIQCTSRSSTHHRTPLIYLWLNVQHTFHTPPGPFSIFVKV